MRDFAGLVAALVLSVAASSAVAAPDCLSGAEARKAVQSGVAIRASAIQHIVKGEILRIRLCRTKRGLIYRVTVHKPNGKVRRVKIEAHSGRILKNKKKKKNNK